MSRRLLVLLIGLVLPSLAGAESSVWRVETVRGALYLAGSIHVLRDSDYPLPEEFEAVYADAEVLVLETDLSASRQESAQALLASRGRYPPGEGLRDHLSPEVYDRLAVYCRERELPLGELERLKPWLLVMTLSVAEMEAEGFDFDAGVDAHLSRRAAADAMPIHGLETMEDQIEALAAFDLRGDPLVANFLDESESYPELIDEMIQAWRAGDVAQLERYVAQDMRKQFPELYRAILVERNRRWLAPLEKWAASGKRVLAVVGAAHLVGGDSVIALLRARGHKVEKFALTAR